MKVPGRFDRGLAMSIGSVNSPTSSLLFLMDLDIQVQFAS